MQEQTSRRVDVGVTLNVSPEGNVRPLAITFENGKTYNNRPSQGKKASSGNQSRRNRHSVYCRHTKP